MVGAEDPLSVGEQPGEQLDGLLDPVPACPGPGGEVVAGGQGVGVVGAEDPLLVGEQPGERSIGLVDRVPASPGQAARLLRVARVSGWSGPRTRCRSASSPVNSGDGLVGRVPGLARPAGEVVAGGQGVGVVGAEDPQPVGEQPGERLDGLVDPSRPRPASGRGCCGWSGCRGGRGRAPAAGRRAAR